MKIHFIALLILSSLNLFGQETQTKKLSVGISYTPSISYRSITNNPYNLKELRKNEDPKYGQSLNLIVHYGINKSIGIESGILFQDRGFKAPFQLVLFGETGRSDEVIHVQMKYMDKFYDIGVPVKFTYRKDFNSIALVSSIGFIGNYLMHRESHVLIDFGDHVDKIINDKTSSFNSFVLTSIFGFGIEWAISEKYNFHIMPTFQRDLTPVIDSGLNMYLWDLGLNIGFIYKF